MTHLLDDPYAPFELDLVHPSTIRPIRPSPLGINPVEYSKLMASRPFLPPVFVLDGLASLLRLPIPVYTSWHVRGKGYFCDVEVGGKSFVSTALRGLKGDAMYDAAILALDVISKVATILS